MSFNLGFTRFYYFLIPSNYLGVDTVTELALSVAEPFSSPAWGSNFVVFTSETGDVIPEALAKAYLNRVSKYAKHYGVYVVPERFMLMDYHCMCLVTPDGNIWGAQKAVYLNLSRPAFKRSSTLEMFYTEFGGVFLCVDVDVYHPEVCRFAQGMGGQIIICSQYLTKSAYDTNMVVSGCWNAAQLANCYTVAVSGQFNCVCSPLAISARGDGFIVPPNLRLPMTTRIHAEKLASVRRPIPLSRKFYAAHRTELLG